VKQYILVTALVLIAGLAFFGCQKKQAELEGTQEGMSMESLSATTAANVTENTAPVAVQPQAMVSPEAKLEPLPQVEPYKPSLKDIQAALKNAGYYTGAVDGKKGPMTNRAIEEFQKANGLKVDGKVGPKTWSALSAHLTSNQ